jgi:very-short-patch-repair endonuclease
MSNQQAHRRKTVERARELRRSMTVPEQKLWRALRGRRLAGLKFVRQFAIGPFIADFVCRQFNLVVEVDGESHAYSGPYDRKRESELERHGFRILRISNDEVLQDMEAVLTAIVQGVGLDVARWRAGEYGQLPEDVHL